MISQGYDGGSVMSAGVQKRIRELAPHTIYIHCYAHTLNLVLVDSVKMATYATEFFGETLYVFMSTTKAHAKSRVNYIQINSHSSFSNFLTQDVLVDMQQ